MTFEASEMAQESIGSAQTEEQSAPQNPENIPGQAKAAIIKPEEAAPSWFYDDGVPGQGDRPDYLVEKYGYNQSKQAKAYRDLEKYVSSTRPIGAPEKYEVNLSEELKSQNVSIPEDDQMLNTFKEYAKKNSLTQEQFDSVVNFYAANNIKTDESVIQDMEMESEKFLKDVGVNVEPKIARQELKNWMLQNGLSAYPEDVDMVLADPYALKVLSVMRKNTHHGVPTPNTQPVIRDMNYWVQKKADKRYEVETAYRKEVDKEFEDWVRKTYGD